MVRALAAAALMLSLAASSARAQPEGTPTPPPQPRAGAAHAVPLYGTLMRVFDAPPDDPYAPGHRGVDVGAATGTPVRASSSGVVSFAGAVAGNLAVTVDHGGGLRTTYSFLGSVAVRAGDSVKRGHAIGAVGSGHPGSGLPAHVHLSARRDAVYFDPLELYVGDAHSDLLAIVG